MMEFRGRYSGSALGVIWAFLQPLTMIAMYTTIFAVVLKVKVGARGDVTDFGLFLICGLIPFNLVADAVRRSVGVYHQQAHLMHRLPMPPVVLPASRVLATIIEQAIALALFIGLLVIVAHPLGWRCLALLVVLPLHIAIALGISVAAACLATRLRDVGNLCESLLTIWFLATPVIYPREMVPGALRGIIDANPMTPLVEAYRALILYDRLPSAGASLYLLAFALFTLLVGSWIYRRISHEIVDHI